MMATIEDRTLERHDLPILEALCHMEELRRHAEGEAILESLETLEQSYFGPEVGAVRRSFNALMMERMPRGGALLDYGCGGPWWKEDYWPRFDRVDAVEVNRGALQAIAEVYPQANLYHTRNGLFDAPIQYDCVVSSSVVGYILPAQAKLHLRICHDVLKPGGTFIFTRVNAFSLIQAIHCQRFAQATDYTFSYAYTSRQLHALLREIGFRDIQYQPLGCTIPRVPWRLLQPLYRAFPRLMRDHLPRLLPFLKYQHFFTATR